LSPDSVADQAAERLLLPIGQRPRATRAAEIAWFPIILLPVVTQEMCARLGAVTGKGLADLIREESGLRATFFMMAITMPLRG